MRAKKVLSADFNRNYTKDKRNKFASTACCKVPNWVAPNAIAYLVFRFVDYAMISAE